MTTALRDYPKTLTSTREDLHWVTVIGADSVTLIRMNGPNELISGSYPLSPSGTDPNDKQRRNDIESKIGIMKVILTGWLDYATTLYVACGVEVRFEHFRFDERTQP